ncbi:anthranilate 1,2-dioxygenase regulatory protein AndR [Paraburkholderia sp.]|uniref:anthranilate 1,2-dioxygenase regulatory protein AndR n=1 Tax=Paraburkholderia sp. TaxID=1926495 RepID=UPI00239AD411|nr:anthranilate 1,2-dioxygenase regulatory protein AndR [Paraburkholderia sp.]MDE1180509.1 AraC family transcriptional regulator [Paraburkholderia sp.]
MVATDISALRDNRLFETPDLDEARALISSVMQPHGLAGGKAHPGDRPKSHMDYVQCGRLGVGTIAFSRATQVTVQGLSNYHLFMYCVSGTAQTQIDSVAARASATQGVFCRSGQQFVADLSPDCEQLVLRIGLDAVNAHTGMSRVAFPNEIALDRLDARPFNEMLASFLGSPALVKSAQTNPIIALEMERLFVALLLHARNETPSQGVRASVAPGIVKRAEDFIRENAASAISLGDIAIATGIPARTLLESFKKFKHCSPMQYLRSYRLELARERLCGASSSDQVTAIAYDCGFFHLGRFSIAYRERFGETPFATLSRHRL